jgi:hypothetical protein
MQKRLVLVSGACGSGKTELRRLAVASPHPAFGATAGIEVDFLYTMGDPHFDRPWPEAARYWDIAREQCSMLANSFFTFGFTTVLVVGNSLHERDAVRPFLGLGPSVQVSHVTLDPSLDTLVDRMATRGDPDKTPDWLQAHLDYMRPFYAGWTFTIDNSSMTTSETFDALVSVVVNAKALLIG